MSSFKFKEFEVQQHSDVFKVGTDAVLLGALAQLSEKNASVLEIGTGTGIIALMLAQRYRKAKINAIDISKAAADLASSNVKKSSFSDSIFVWNQRMQDLDSNEKFDFIVSNPPYFENSTLGKHQDARHSTMLPFIELIQCSAERLTLEGHLQVILPFINHQEFVQMCSAHGLFLQHQITISNKPKSEPRRVILNFLKKATDLSESHFIIRNEDNSFSQQYIKATKLFHPFL